MSFTADRVRQTFVEYFVDKGHRHVASSSLIPAEDPTLLFTNAGMNQFKSVFLGEAERGYTRAVSVQKCMRVSGKHNDLETVGPSLAHHTFFEMLGNFSFGDYFKAEAIGMAWELFTQGYGLPKERLWATVYERDDEAARLWESETDLLPGRVVRLGKQDNYWSMGETGPCGPCSELHYDYDWDGQEPAEPDMDSSRFVELWNLVFMQFNAAADGSIEPLPRPNIDTGAGLERLTAVLQGTRSNYDTDLFRPLIDAVAETAGRSYGESDETDIALRVIADHSRALAFLLADGVMPANEGRGYVLRRLLRRAMRFGIKLGFDAPFLYQSALRVIERMSPAYPELEAQRSLIERVTRAEEDRFLQTLAAGSRMFNEMVQRLRAAGQTVIPGEQAFRLYDTHGLPIELAREFAAAESLTIDEAGFERAMQAQRSRARSAWKGAAGEPLREVIRKVRAEHGPTRFLAYDHTELAEVTVLALVRDARLVSELDAGTQGGMVLDRTPFYAESGGQVGDCGWFEGDAVRGLVLDAKRPVTGSILHRLEVQEGTLKVGDRLHVRVDAERRMRTRRNHTATHLLHAVLRERLGEHVRQAGSLVQPDRLRFDFTHYAPLDPDEIEQMEWQVNEAILRDVDLQIEEMSYDEAIERGALAFFGEKYGERVRVVSVPGVSMELCGGTHVDRTGQIGPFLIRREESVAAGTRRIEAITGEAAVEALQRYRRLVREAAAGLRTQEDALLEGIQRLSARLHDRERRLEQLQVKVEAERAAADLGASAQNVAGVRLLCREVAGVDAAGMRELADRLKQQLGSGIIVLGTRRDGKAALVVGVTPDLAERVSAGDLVRSLAPIVGGGGGGHREMAQAGGPDAAKVSDALDRVPKLIAELLQ